MNKREAAPTGVVVLSYSVQDERAAAQVREYLEGAGLSVFPATDQWSEPEDWKQVRDAIAQSEAVVILVTESSLRAEKLIFVAGGAEAREKPLYMVAEGLPRSSLPVFLQDRTVFSIKQLPQVVQEILRGRVEFSEEESRWLKEWYRDTNIPLDQLIRYPAELEAMTRGFRVTWQRNVPAERLLQELYRLRKKAQLPRTRRKAESSHSD